MKFVRILSVFLAGIFVFSWTEQAFAFQDYCPSHNTKTYMKTKKYKTRVFRGTVSGFNKYLFGHSRGNSQGGVVLAFVDYNELDATFEAKYEVTEIGPDKFCVRMTHVRAFFGMHPKNYMPTDYKKKSC